jgi:hypothetical protein
MKYIVTLIDGKESIFVFPKCIDHDRFHESLAAIRFGSEQHWKRHVLGCPSDLVSAGFITSDGKCYGHSETLNKKSRGDADTALLGA